MAAKKRTQHRGRKGQGKRRAGGPAESAGEGLTVRRVPGQEAFELVFPGCVEERKEDLEDVRAMIEEGEFDVAMDELRWLLADCRPLLEAHRLLGEIALIEEDMQLAQAHLGYAYQMGIVAIPKEGLSGPLPYERPANQAFFEAGKGLAWCLKNQGGTQQAKEVVETLLRLDPNDPLGLKGLLE